ncbi:GntR family transcriptional regulator, partial [Pseudomonas aeruginosa]
MSPSLYSSDIQPTDVFMLLMLDPTSVTPLVSQIVEGIALAIQEQRLRPGAKLPSIRKFAESHGVSHFTVAEAYDRLVARGCLNTVPNAGYYVRGQVAEDARDAEDAPEFDFDAHLLLH